MGYGFAFGWWRTTSCLPFFQGEDQGREASVKVPVSYWRRAKVGEERRRGAASSSLNVKDLFDVEQGAIVIENRVGVGAFIRRRRGIISSEGSELTL